MVLLAIISVVLLLWPLRLQLDAGKDDDTALKLFIRLGPFSLTRRLKVIKRDGRHQLVRQAKDGHDKPVKASELRGGRSETVLRALWASDHARNLLMRRTHLHTIRGYLCIAGEDAAKTALLVQSLRTGCNLLPPGWRRAVRLQILPAFFRDHSVYRLRCIVSWRLGILVITAGMLAAAYAVQQVSPKKEAA